MNIAADRIKAPWHVWVIGVLSLLFNAMGATDYTMTQMRNMTYLVEFGGMTPEQLDYIMGFPAWANAFWALGTWGAFIGSALILLRSRWSVTAFIVSLIGLVGTTIFQYGIADMPASFNTAGAKAFYVFIWATVLLLLYYSMRMRAKGVFR